MTLKKINFLLLIILLLTGCSTKPDIIIPSDRSSINLTKGTIQTKPVNNFILKRDYFVNYPEFSSDEEINFPRISRIALSPLPSGIKLKVMWMYENGSFLCEPASGLIINTRAISPFPACLVIDSNGKMNGFAYCHHPEHPLINQKFTNISFQKTNKINSTPVHSEIIYSGRSYNLIKMQYREFKDGTAHPLFYQELIYDLSESGTIIFRGTKIEIIEANDSLIRYRVIEGAANWHEN
ncbi:MAG: hypothetical protein ABFD50_02655 [Smithella sp.]